MIDTSFTTTQIKAILGERQIILFGLAREGWSSYQFLRTHLPEKDILLTDDKTVAELTVEWQKALQTDQHLHFFSPEAILQHLTSALYIFKTPGIPPTNALFAALSQYEVKWSSNTELFFNLLNSLPANERPTTIGVTGTKGKSTTTALIAHVLQSAQKPTFLAGNIGTPALTVWEELEKSSVNPTTAIVVLELSSHQLQELTSSPHIAVLQNITPEHLDYYRSFEEYWQAKARITQFQGPQDIFIYNQDFELPAKIAKTSQAKQHTYSLNSSSSEAETTYHDQALWYKKEKIIDQSELPFLGEHNILNTFPAIIIAKLLEIPTSVLAEAIKNFKPLEHRLEFVAEKNGVLYYNDSQGTTPEAAIAAIASFGEKPIILLAGGSDKGVSFAELAEVINTKNILELILFPPTGEKIATAVREVQEKAKTPREITMVTVQSMTEAVKLASSHAQYGSVVLLSPACASFGLFKNYQDRGNQFKAAVREISPATAM